jgi:hypothetical protein
MKISIYFQHPYRSKKWLILTGHRPMYTSCTSYNSFQPDSQNLVQNLEPLMVKYGVDVAFWGHVHNYERTCPMVDYNCVGTLDNMTAPVHFIVGNVRYNWIILIRSQGWPWTFQ